ncbi:ExeM/NucH family extracellular endonuclease [Arcanobacterium phocae]|uniref:ExeM/NucH family extracellular endonuclease n=1 Tax=Arcanobacterium phocae TaxID=131112 RepID=UPI001C10CA29|nr:ExeM/NucH family extracellular endonuclease [Arcanobacterium phocae]
MKLSRSMKIAAVFTASLLALPAATQPAVAAGAVESKGADHLVINEVYVYGASKGAQYCDYVELYNPTSENISLSGRSLVVTNSKGKDRGSISLPDHEIATGGFFLIQGKCNSDQTVDSPDLTAKTKLDLAQNSGAVTLLYGDVVEDLVGWGSGFSKSEKEPFVLEEKDKAKSLQRQPFGKDTDNNSDDFVLAEATPMNSQANAGADSGNEQPETPPADGEQDEPSNPDVAGPETPATEVTIDQIQGTTDKTPYEGKIVTTKGVITAIYKYGGFQGFYMQTPGTGTNVATDARTASDGIFVYVGNFSKLVDKTGNKTGNIDVGDYLEVTGTATEHFGLTQVSVYKNNKSNENKSASVTKITNESNIVAPKPVVLERIPDTEADREKLEGMLVKVTGKYTISANYYTNQHGRFDIAPGEEPFRIPSDTTNDKDQWPVLAAKIDRERIALDDGASVNYVDTGNKKNPWPNYQYSVPYLDVNKPLRVGTVITLPQPMILDYRGNRTGFKNKKPVYENRWNLQPTKPLTDKDISKKDEWKSWVNFTSTREKAPQFKDGNVTITSFNVLNYFPTLGEDTKGCSAYKAYDGTGLTNTGKKCAPRGAYSQKAFEMQQSKIVKAINELDSTVVGLEEIENSVKFGEDRDAAIGNLVNELNKDAGKQKWAFVKSPDAKHLPKLADQDVIRLAFIYQQDLIEPVDESKVLYDGKEWKYARQPLAQKFRAIRNGQAEGKPFVVVINHLKSKGSLKDDTDTDQYQGNNNQMRVRQVTEMAQWVAKNFAGAPVFVIGDLNSYSHEDPLTTLETKFGYTSIAEAMKVKNHSYQFGGVVGSLDHALGNAEAMKMVKAADVWNVNAMEPVAFEYARWNYNVNYKNLFDADSPYRSSDHDPIKVAIDTRNSVPWTELTPATPVDPEPQPEPQPQPDPEPQPEPQPQPDPEPQPEATVVTPKASAVNPQASDPAACKITPFVTIEPIEGVTYQVTVDGKQLKPVDGNANKFEYPYGKTVKVVATLKDGYKLAEGAQTEWSWTAPTREELKCSVPWTELTPATPAPQDPAPQDPTPQDPTPVPDQPGQDKKDSGMKDSGKKDSKSGKSGLAKTGIETSGLAGLAVIAMIAGGAIVARRRNA